MYTLFHFLKESIVARLKCVEATVEIILENLPKPDNMGSARNSLNNNFLETVIRKRQKDKIGRKRKPARLLPLQLVM